MDGIGLQSPPIVDDTSVQITYKEYSLPTVYGGTTIYDYPPSTFYLIVSATPGGSHGCDPRPYVSNALKFSSQSTPWDRNLYLGHGTEAAQCTVDIRSSRLYISPSGTGGYTVYVKIWTISPK